MIIPFFQGKKLARYYFMDVGRGPETLESETEEFITHGLANSPSISTFVLVSFVSKSFGGDTKGKSVISTYSGLC